MKSLLTSLFLSGFCVGGFCQDWQTVETNEHYSISIAEIEYKSPADGINHQRFIFKYENYTSSPIELHFNREVKYANVVTTQEQDYVVAIPSNAVVQYDETTNRNKAYYIYKKDNENFIPQSLQDFKIINLRIN